MADQKKATVKNATAPKTETVQVTGKVVGGGDAGELKTQELDKVDNATALQLQDLQSPDNSNINTDKKTSDADLPQKSGSLSSKSDVKVNADEVGSKENKVTHEISGKNVYETARDYQASLKKD